MENLIARKRQEKNVSWSAANASAAVDLEGMAGGMLYIDGSFTGAALTFQVSYDGGTTYATLQDDGADVSISVTADRVAVLPAELFGARFVKFVSDASETCTGRLMASS